MEPAVQALIIFKYRNGIEIRKEKLYFASSHEVLKIMVDTSHSAI